MNVLISVLLMLLVVAVIMYLVDWVGFPSPLNWIVKAIIVLIAIMLILSHLGVVVPFL